MNNAVCRKCRREGKKLFLKGEKCFSAKCPFTRRPYAPGSKGVVRGVKLSDYGCQLREKQKAKVIYGLKEQQFRNYYKKAAKIKEATGEKLLQFLERRLDNVVYHLGFASSHRQARQMVSHKKFLVNDKKNNIPSHQLKEKDKIEPVDKKNFKLNKSEIPIWLKLDKKNLIGQLIKIPSREEIQTDLEEDLIVEFYSR